MSTPTAVHEVFHEGELAVQKRAGVVAQGRNSGRMIADTIIPGAIKFVKKQSFAVLGSVDDQQNVWASPLVGTAGFMEAEPRSFTVDLAQAVRATDDPLWRNLTSDSRIGILVIDLGTRARLRVNGRALFSSVSQLHVDVDQAYPNCPRYIQRRIYRPTNEPGENSRTESASGNALNDMHRQWIAAADTLFVASEHTSGGLDASHRGGNPGFIRVLGPNRLRIPDYAGNGMFNTLGNFAVNPRAGLLIPDFEIGRTLQLTGRAEIVWDIDDPHNETGGTRRYWDFENDRWLQLENSLPGSSEFLDYSPHNPSSIG
jgi:hypothetical protein